MKYLDFMEEIGRRKGCKILLCAPLGSGKTTFLKFVFRDLAAGFDKYKVIPLFVRASEILPRENLIDYLLKTYCDTVSQREKEDHLDRQAVFRNYLNDNRYRFLLMIDETELLGEKRKDLLHELEQLNACTSLSVIFSTADISYKDAPAFCAYQVMEDFGRLSREQILNYLRRKGFAVQSLSASWQQLLNTRFYLTKFAALYRNTAVLSQPAFGRAKLIEDYLNEFVGLNCVPGEEEYEKRRDFVFSVLPKMFFEAGAPEACLPDNVQYGIYAKNLPAINVLNPQGTGEAYRCRAAHLLYYYFFCALYIKNYLCNNRLAECAALLDRQMLSREILLFLGELLGVTNDSRTSCRLYNCLNYIRVAYQMGSGYPVAVCNILNVFASVCSRQLAGLDLSYLDLTQCSFIGINCQKAVFYGSALRDVCLIPPASFGPRSHAAIQPDGRFFVLADDASAASDYCFVNIFNSQNGALQHGLVLPYVYSVCAVDADTFAIAWGNETRRISLLRYCDGKVKKSFVIDEDCLSLSLAGRYSYCDQGHDRDLLFYFADQVLCSVSLDSGAVTKYDKVLKTQDHFKLLNAQNEKTNNGIVFYSDTDEEVCVSYIRFCDLLHGEYGAVVHTVQKFDLQAHVYFSEHEPVFAVSSADDFKIYNYVSWTGEPDDTDVYCQQSSIFCRDRVIRLGTEEAHDEQSVSLPAAWQLVYAGHHSALFLSADSSRIVFYDCKEDRRVRLANRALTDDNLKIENIEYKQLALYNKNFRHFGTEGKRYVFDIASKKFVCEHIESWSDVFKFKCYDNGTVTDRYYKNCNDLVRDYCKFHFVDLQCDYDENGASDISLLFPDIVQYDNNYFQSVINWTKFEQYFDVKLCNIFCVLEERLSQSTSADGDVLLVVNDSDKEEIRLKIYNYLQNKYVIDFVVPKELCMRKTPIRKYAWLFPGETYFKKQDDGSYEIFVKDHRFYFDENGCFFKAKTVFVNPPDYDVDQYYNLLETVLDLYKKCKTIDNQSLILYSVEFLQRIIKYLIQNGLIARNDFEFARGLAYIILNMAYHCKEDDYAVVYDILYTVPQLVLYSDAGRVLNGQATFSYYYEKTVSMLMRMSELTNIIGTRNNLKIRNTVDKCNIINHPILDLDITGADFRNVSGLSESTKRLIDLYSGKTTE